MSDQQQLYIFDLCGTLYQSNTTFDFLDFYFLDKSRSYRFNRKIFKTIPWRLFNRVLMKLLDLDLTRYICIRQLRKYNKEQLSQMADHFVTAFLNTRKFQVTQHLLREAQAGHREVMIMSASLDFIVAAVAKELQVTRFYSSELEYEGDICTGKLRNDLLGKKSAFCRNSHIPLEEAIIVTDNLSDQDLVSLASEAYIVCASKHVKFWEKFRSVKQIYCFE